VRDDGHAGVVAERRVVGARQTHAAEPQLGHLASSKLLDHARETEREGKMIDRSAHLQSLGAEPDARNRWGFLLHGAGKGADE
jgi:hypothetical protein